MIPIPQIPFWTIDEAFSTLIRTLPHGTGVRVGVGVSDGIGERVGVGDEVGRGDVGVRLGISVGVEVCNEEVACKGMVDETDGDCVVGTGEEALEQPEIIRSTKRKYNRICLFTIPPQLSKFYPPSIIRGLYCKD